MNDTLTPKRSDAVFKASVVLVFILPFAGLIAGLIFFWKEGIDYLSLAMFGIFYLLTGFGITVGFHRLYTHKAFETYPTVKAIFGILGMMAFEGSVVKWVAGHRQHHLHSDDELDPHSPVFGRKGFVQLVSGLVHAHLGWIISSKNPPHPEKYAPDLLKDKIAVAVSRYALFWALLGLFLPGFLGLIITGSWKAALLCFLWGGLARIFFVHHVTWGINSICHIFGSQPCKSHDNSRNNWLLALLGLGEGWHNFHHAFQTSARHGLRWWEIDFSWYLICFLKWIGLAWNLKVPSETQFKAALVRVR